MAEADILIFEGIYKGMWSKVNTTFGETAEIPLQSGSCQGCPLSPTTFIVFLDLCLRHLHATGPGMTFRAQYFKPPGGEAERIFANQGAFVDDVGLICHTAADMNSLLVDSPRRVYTAPAQWRSHLQVQTRKTSRYRFSDK